MGGFYFVDFCFKNAMILLLWFHVFLATCNYKLVTIWPYRLTVRTPASQALNPGSIPGRVTSI